jgi:D-beta-D-heptose 7-phosphate kinase/D-beta-D-heptose 1-phosphate adenosyltransferase
MKIKSTDELIEIAARLKRENKRIVFTNGCFDLLHVGHVRFLKQARSLGDVLMVGINSDASVHRIKGKTRPILGQEERSEVLAALEAVDYVTVFDESTPWALIKKIRPHVLVKGADWGMDEIVGRDIVEGDGGEVANLPLVDGISTSKIIEKIIKLHTGC